MRGGGGGLGVGAASRGGAVGGGLRGRLLLLGSPCMYVHCLFAEAQLQLMRKNMGMVFQEGALFDSLSVYDNVAYRLHEEGERDEAKIEQRVREVLSFVEMEEAIDKMPDELSGGMRRRVSIARAIISEPSIMLYDSPTGGLDPVTAHTINILIAKLRDVKGVTSVVVTHRIQNAYELANFVFAPEKRTLVPIGTNGGSARSAATRFLLLRDGGIYFQGKQEERSEERRVGKECRSRWSP